MFVSLMQRLRPLRGLSVWLRYLLTAAIVLTCFGARYALQNVEHPQHLPLFMLFVPAVIVASFVFDRGSGFLAVALSTLLGSYFFIEPERAFAIEHGGEWIRLATFVITGMLTASIIEALRVTVDQLRTTIEALGAAEESIRSHLALMNDIMEGTPDPIFVKDRRGRYLHVNGATARVLGTSKERLIGRAERDLIPPDAAARIEQSDQEVMSSGRTLILEEVMTSASGEARTYLTTKAPWLGSNGEVLGVIGVARDIHERKLIEQQLEAANAQKQLLLNDINHRVKNHLHTIASLLHAGKHRLRDQDARATLDSAIAQVQVLARVYDRLQITEESTAVDACDFIRGLCADLRATLPGQPFMVIHCDVERRPLDSSHAVLLGLAINELVMNAVKYAFADGREGVIEVLLRTAGNTLRLEVVDNGIGMSVGAQPGRGQRLVRSFARELGGTVEWICTDEGTRVTLIAPASA